MIRRNVDSLPDNGNKYKILAKMQAVENDKLAKEPIQVDKDFVKKGIQMPISGKKIRISE